MRGKLWIITIVAVTAALISPSSAENARQRAFRLRMICMSTITMGEPLWQLRLQQCMNRLSMVGTGRTANVPVLVHPVGPLVHQVGPLVR